MCFPLSSFPLFTYLRTFSTAPTTPAAISSTLVCKPHPFFMLDSPLLILSQSKTSSSFANQLPRAYINETSADCSLSGQLSSRSPLRPPPFSCRQHHHLFPAKCRPQNRISDFDPVSDQAKSFIQRLATLDLLHCSIAQVALRDPWLIPTTTNTPSHVDLSTYSDKIGVPES